MNKDQRYIILNRLQAQTSHPITELLYQSPFELLIAVMLSARSTDVSVNKATRLLFPVANTPQSILALGVDGIKSYIRSIGLFNKKAKNIIKTCLLLSERHHNTVPQNRAALEALPGVGRKTANVVLNIAFGWPTIAVDTHVFRVVNRTRFAVGKNAESVEQRLLTVVPEEFKMNCHHLFIKHGRHICTACKPYCNSCLIEDLCEYDQKYYR